MSATLTDTIIIKVEPKVKAKVKELAATCNRDLSDYVRLVIQGAIDKKQRV